MRGGLGPPLLLSAFCYQPRRKMTLLVGLGVLFAPSGFDATARKRDGMPDFPSLPSHGQRPGPRGSAPAWLRVAAASGAVLAMLALSGCGSAGHRLPLPKADFVDEPEAPIDPPREEAINRLPTKDDAHIKLPLGPGALKIRPSRPDDHLVGVITRPVQFTGVSLENALRAVLIDTGYGLVVTHPQAAATTITVSNLTGSLDSVVRTLCLAANAYCRVGGKAVEIIPEETFTVELPPIVEKGETIADAIKAIVGGTGSTASDQNGNAIVFRANAEKARQVEDYLRQVRSRPLILLDVWIAEVSLSATNANGIRWDRLNGTVGGLTAGLTGGAATLGSAAMGLSTSFTGRNLDVSALIQFLREQGSVNTIAQPQIAMASGTRTEFRDGGEFSYVDRAGVLTAGNTTGSTTGSNGLANNTVNTARMTTGMSLDMRAQYYGDMVWTNIDLKIDDLAEMKEISSGGVVVQLPRTTNRRLKGFSGVRPGDALLLAGIRSSRASGDDKGFGLGDRIQAPTQAKREASNSEVVMLVRPRVIEFFDPEQAETDQKVEADRKGSAP